MPDKRLIDANALTQKFTAMQECANMRDHVYLMGVLSVIDNALTIDTVEVVRCRECAGRKKNKFCIEWLKYVPDDGFCYLGAKMDGNKKED